jgi:hypothetical protein
MMIVVLGDEEHQIDNAYSHVQSRMQRHPLHKRSSERSRRRTNAILSARKRSENILDGVRVVIRFVRLTILHVGSNERFAPGFEIVDAVHAQRFKVEQMSGLFLNRPFVAIAPR